MSVLGDCPNCGKAIHSLDGSVASGGKPFTHFDCEKAAAIDYAAAFDKLMQLALEARDRAWGLMEETMDDEALQKRIDPLLVGIYSGLADATSWLTYNQERGVTA